MGLVPLRGSFGGLASDCLHQRVTASQAGFSRGVSARMISSGAENAELTDDKLGSAEFGDFRKFRPNSLPISSVIHLSYYDRSYKTTKDVCETGRSGEEESRGTRIVPGSIPL